MKMQNAKCKMQIKGVIFSEHRYKNETTRFHRFTQDKEKLTPERFNQGLVIILC
jgi:hypothetical protein